MRPLASLRACLGLLTIFPVGRVDYRRHAAAGIGLAPLAGLLLWLVAAGAALVMRRWTGAGAGGLLPAVTALALLAALTRGLHLDGLADTADGLGSFRPPETVREVMTGGTIGALGALTLVLVLLGQAACLQALFGRGHGALGLLAMVLAGRLALVLGCRRGTPVMPGSTLGVLVVGRLSGLRLVLAGMFVEGAVIGAALIDRSVSHTAGNVEVVQAALAPLAGVLVGALLQRHCAGRLGGVNGDVLGASCEIASLAALLVLVGQP